MKTLLLKLSWASKGETMVPGDLEVSPPSESATTSIVVSPSDDVFSSIQKVDEKSPRQTLMDGGGAEDE